MLAAIISVHVWVMSHECDDSHLRDITSCAVQRGASRIISTLLEVSKAPILVFFDQGTFYLDSCMTQM